MTVTTQEDRPAWIYRKVPAFDSLRRYRLPAARADLFAGITVAAVAVPQAMAYALAAGLPASSRRPSSPARTAAMDCVGAMFQRGSTSIASATPKSRVTASWGE